MADDLHKLDWSLVQAFLAVAETGSLSGAARKLGTSQPTLGRQIRMLEEALGSVLFERRARGMALSTAGADLLPPAEAMAEAAGALALSAAGHAQDVAGTVRITASVFTAVHHLPAILAKLRAEEPDIQIELVATDTTENLLFREADIAVRMYRPTQLDVVSRHLGNVELGIYASQSYLNRCGTPASLADLFAYDLIGYDRSELILRGMQDAGWRISREDFATRCDQHDVYFQLIAAGLGIGFAQVAVADRTGGLVRLLPKAELPMLPVWLTAHPKLRRVPRVARVWDALADGLAPGLLPA